jgi:hypothetical protein
VYHNSPLHKYGRIEDPTKYDLEQVSKLAYMIDFMKGRMLPFSLIANEAVKRKIITEEERESLYQSFIKVVRR